MWSSNNGLPVRIRRVQHKEDPAVVGFVSTYRDVFAGHPYYESYELDWVREEVFEPHLPHCVLVAEHNDDGRVVALACCHGVLADTEPAIRDYLLQQEPLPFPPRRTIFMSELAVRDEMRMNRLGTALVHARLEWAGVAGFTHYAMRTAADGSNSERLYTRLGAARAPFVQDVSNGEIASASTQRIYLWGEIGLALAK